LAKAKQKEQAIAKQKQAAALRDASMKGAMTSSMVSSVVNSSLSSLPSEDNGNSKEVTVSPSTSSMAVPSESPIVSIAASVSPNFSTAEADLEETSASSQHPQKRSRKEGSLDKIINLLFSFSKQSSPSYTGNTSSPTGISYRNSKVVSSNGTIIISTTRFLSTTSLLDVLNYIKEGTTLPDDTGWKFSLDDMELTLQLTLADVLPNDNLASLTLSRKEKKTFSMDDF